jgi:hypothetical protein
MRRPGRVVEVVHHHHHYYPPQQQIMSFQKTRPFEGFRVPLLPIKSKAKEQRSTIFSTEKVQRPMVPLNPGCPERLAKVRRYLEKRKNRKWVKKVSYVCRRTTAEKRLRIKGRFVKNSD